MHHLLTGQLTVEKLQIEIAGLSPSLSGTVVVQMSDFHYSRTHLSPALLKQAIAIANHAQADLVVLTGDYVAKDPSPIYQLTHDLQKLRSRLGTYAILGNHDYQYPSAQATISNALTDAGIQVLWDRVVYPWGKGLALVGLSDYYSPSFNPDHVMQQVPSQVPRIVLSHNPDTAEMLKAYRVDLQLSGHTHGGQIVMPGYGPLLPHLKRLFGPLSISCQMLRALRKCTSLKQALKYLQSLGTQQRFTTIRHWEWAQGLHQVSHNLLYVNRGLGTHPPGRFCCPPEVTIITLVATT